VSSSEQLAEFHNSSEITANNIRNGKGTSKSANHDLLDKALNKIKTLKELRNADSSLLKESASTTIIPSNDSYISNQLEYFYSEDFEVREQAFEENIRDEIYEILKLACDASLSFFPQSLGIFKRNLSLLNQKKYLQRAAIEDIFEDTQFGLDALETAIKSLKDNTKLTSEQKKPLKLFLALSGFFNDFDVMSNYIEQPYCKLNSLSPDNPLHRIQLVKLIQYQGEHLPHMHPWTFGLSSDQVPYEVLKDLRLSFSHFTSEKLKDLLQISPESNEIFAGVIKEQTSIFNILKNMYEKHPLYPPINSSSNRKTHVPSNRPKIRTPWQGKEIEHQERQLWQKIKNFVSLNNSSQTGYEYHKGLKQFLVSNLPLVEKSLDLKLFPISYLADTEEHKNFMKNYKEIWTILQSGYKKSQSEFLKDCEKLNSIFNMPNENNGRTIYVLPEEELIDKYLELRSLHKDIIRAHKFREKNKAKLSQNKLNDEAKSFQDELNVKAKFSQNELNDKLNEFIYKVLSFSKKDGDSIRQEVERKNQLENIKKYLQQQKNEQRPFRGYGNISEMYQKFVISFLKKTIIPEDFEQYINFKAYSWSTEPSQIELWFYQIHNINFRTLEDKNNFRIQKIQELLDIIKYIRQEAVIEVTVEDEVERESLALIIINKTDILRNFVTNFIDTKEADKSIQVLKKTINDFITFYIRDNFIKMLIALTQGAENEISVKEAYSVYQSVQQEFNKIKGVLLNLKNNYSDYFSIVFDDFNSEIDQIFNNASLEDILERIKFTKSKLESQENVFSFVKDIFNEKVQKLTKIIEKLENNSTKQQLHNIMSNMSELPKIIHARKNNSNRDDIVQKFDLEWDKFRKFLNSMPARSYNSKENVTTFQQGEMNENKDAAIAWIEQEFRDSTRAEKIKILKFHSRSQSVKSNPRTSFSSFVNREINNQLKQDGRKIPVFEFLVGTFYEQLEELFDYPEFKVLASFKKVRNYYSHPLTNFKMLQVEDGCAWHEIGIGRDRESTISKELTILGMDVKFILEDTIRLIKNI